jgi:hypothetical protein
VGPQGLELFGARRIERRVDGLRARGPLAQTGESCGVAGVDGVAHGLSVAAHVGGEVTSTLASGTGQQDLTAAQDTGLARPQACLQGLTLGLRQ